MKKALAGCVLAMALTSAAVAEDRGEPTLSQLRASAQAGDPHAEWALGLRYSDGQEVTKDDGQAFEWTRKAAEGRYIPAWLSLGFIYGEGRGVAADPAQSYKWFDLIVTLIPPDYPNHDELLADAVTDRNLMAKKLTATQIASARASGKAWWNHLVLTTTPYRRPAAAQ